MAAPKKTFDMDVVSATAVTQVKALAKSDKRVTVDGVVQAMLAAGSDIATTRLGFLLKELSDTNRLEGFYLRRGSGFVHESDVPRPKKTRKRKAKAEVVTPSTLAAEIDKQEEEAALEEFRASCREKHRKALGLAS